MGWEQLILRILDFYASNQGSEKIHLHRLTFQILQKNLLNSLKVTLLLVHTLPPPYLSFYHCHMTLIDPLEPLLI